MRRSFLFVAIPLAAALAVPLLLVGRAGPQEWRLQPWGLSVAERAPLVDIGVRLGLRRDSVEILTGAGPTVGGQPFLLGGRDRDGRLCVYVVHGSSHSSLRCLSATLRRRPLMLVGFDVAPAPHQPRHLRELVGLARADVGSVVMVAPGQQPVNLALSPAHGVLAFNVGVPASTVLEVNDQRGRRLATMHVPSRS